VARDLLRQDVLHAHCVTGVACHPPAPLWPPHFRSRGGAGRPRGGRERGRSPGNGLANAGEFNSTTGATIMRNAVLRAFPAAIRAAAVGDLVFGDKEQPSLRRTSTRATSSTLQSWAATWSWAETCSLRSSASASPQSPRTTPPAGLTPFDFFLVVMRATRKVVSTTRRVGSGYWLCHPPTPLASRCRWTAAGSHPSPGTMLCADFLNFVSTPCGRAKTSVHVPLDGLSPARSQALPPSGASFCGPTMGQIGWGGARLRATGPTLFFGAAGVSPFWCELLRAGCCCGGGGEGVLGVS